MVGLVTSKMKMIHPKKKALDWSHHYKSTEIFPDAEGQLTHSPWSNPAEF